MTDIRVAAEQARVALAWAQKTLRFMLNVQTEEPPFGGMLQVDAALASLEAALAAQPEQQQGVVAASPAAAADQPLQPPMRHIPGVRVELLARAGQASPAAADLPDAHFLAARLRRLFAHFGLPLPSFASDDARLIGIAGSAIGMLLTRWETGEPKGWRLVPEQWTSDMAHAGYMVHQHKDIACQECGDIYRAMLAAAPRHDPGTNEQGAAT